MNIKNISCFLFLFCANFIYSSPFAAKLMLDNTKEKQRCTKQPIEQKNQLFLQAKKCELEYVHACKQCSQIDDCRTNKQYRQVRKQVISSIVDLIYYIDNFEDDTISEADEKNEAEHIKNQLIQLLENTTTK